MSKNPELPAHTLFFTILGQTIRIVCRGRPSLAQAISANYASLAAGPDGRIPDLEYVVTEQIDTRALSVARAERSVDAVPGLGELLYVLEKDITVALQQRRPDLLFLHAAALEYAGLAYLLAGESGGGKSTTAWGLIHHGFGYLSDELSPVDLASLCVLPYPHALCLKRRPPPAYPLPATDVLVFDKTTHVPVSALPGAIVAQPCRLGGVLFVRYHEGAAAPALRAIGAAEAGARLYTTTLNALAHPNGGLDAVVQIVRSVPCFALACADLRATCQAVRKLVLDRDSRNPSQRTRPSAE